MAFADTARLIASLELDPRKFTKGLSNAEKSLGKMESRAYRVGQNIGVGIKNIGRLGIAAAGSIGAISIASLKIAGDFEAQLNTINTIARQTPEGIAAIGESIRKIARDTGTPLDELTQGYYDLLSAGVSVAGAQKVLLASNKLAIGGLASTAETVDLLTTAINTYGLHSRDAAKVADIFAKAVERGKVTAAELAASFAIVGPIAASAGISISEVSAAYARLTASGVPAAEAATQTRAAIQALGKQTPALKKLSKQTGVNYLALAGKRGLVAALEQMRKDAEKSGIPLRDLTGRIEAQNFILQTTGPNFRKYNKDLNAMGDAAGTAAAQMAERQKGLNFQLDKLKAGAKDAAIVIGSQLLPKITPLLDRFNKFLGDPATQNAINQFGDKLAGLFTDQNIQDGIDALKGAFNLAKDAAPALADAAKITGAVMKTAVDLFKSLPPEIQSLAVAGLAINKITGGLVTNIAGGLISAILRNLTTAVVGIQAGVVNVTGGVPGAPGGPGGAPVGKPGAPKLPGRAITPAIGAGVVLDPEIMRVINQGWEDVKKIKEDAHLALSNNDRDAAHNEQMQARQIRAAEAVKEQAARSAQEEHGRGERLVQSGIAVYNAVNDSKSRLAAVMRETNRETNRGLAATAAAARAGGARAAQAIRDKKLTSTVNVTVQNNTNITTRDIAKKLSFSQNMRIYG